MLQDSFARREELRARAKGLKTLGKIFQVSLFVYLSIHLWVLICISYLLFFGELSLVILPQRVKLNGEGNAPTTVNNTINNSDNNVGDSSPESPRVQPFDADPQYSQVPTIL